MLSIDAVIERLNLVELSGVNTVVEGSVNSCRVCKAGIELVGSRCGVKEGKSKAEATESQEVKFHYVGEFEWLFNSKSMRMKIVEIKMERKRWEKIL